MLRAQSKLPPIVAATTIPNQSSSSRPRLSKRFATLLQILSREFGGLFNIIGAASRMHFEVVAYDRGWLFTRQC